MKVLLVEFSPSGGLYQFAFQLGEALVRAGHVVELLTGPDPELVPRTPGLTLLPELPTWHAAEAVRPPVPVRLVRRGIRAARHVAAWRRVLDHVARSQPDVVLWAEWRFSMDGWFAARVARRHGGRMVLGDLAHTPRPFSEQRTRGSLYKRAPGLQSALSSAYELLDVVFVLGERSRSDFLDAFPAVRRVEVVPHGNEDVFVSGPVPPPHACPPRILFFGTLARYKGLELLLDSFVLLRRAVPEAELVIAGAPADVDVDWLTLRVEAVEGAELRLGYVPAGEVAGLFGSARLVVAPYVLANQSGVVHLGQTFARPVVATDVGDLRNAVRHGETGLLVQPDDPSALAEALSVLLRDPAAATRLGAAGRRRLEAESSWDDVAARMTATWQELAQAKHRRRQESR